MALSVQESYDMLVTQVHAPVFFNKLAQHGIPYPTTEEEAINVLQLAGKIRNAYERETVKAAGQRTEFAANLSNSLDAFLARQYGDNSAAETQYKEAAAEAMQLPQLREAAEIFNQYLAAQKG